MAQDSDQEIVDLMDGMADDLREKGAQTNRRRSGTTTEGMGPNRFLLIGGAIVLVVFVVIFLFRGGDGLAPDELKAIQGNLSQLDDRMTRIEGMMDRVPELVKQMEGIRQDIDSMDNSLKGLKTGISRTDKKIAALQKKTTSSGDVSKATEKRYHTVRSGDTLFGIAKKYGLSVNDLRRLNSKLGKSGKIVPGQKLLVGPL